LKKRRNCVLLDISIVAISVGFACGS